MTTRKRLTEGYALASMASSQIDREAGIIHDVKVLGLESTNGRKYLQEACDRAHRLYENVDVYVDHQPASSSAARPTREFWGVLKGVSTDVVNGGMRGDLHYSKSHALTDHILESVERFHKGGLSHDIDADTSMSGDTEVIHEIVKVYSVDFVTRPATTKNLFESERRMSKRKVLEVLRQNVKVGGVAGLVARLSEMDGYSDMPMNELDSLNSSGEEAAPDASTDVKAAFRTVVMAILDDDTIDVPGKIAKIKLVLGVQDKVEGTTSVAVDDAALTGETMVESELRKRLEATEGELKAIKEERESQAIEQSCRSLLESANVEPTELRIRALRPLKEEDRKLVAAEMPKRTVRPSHSSGRLSEAVASASSQSSGMGVPEPGDSKALASFLKQ